MKKLLFILLLTILGTVSMNANSLTTTVKVFFKTFGLNSLEKNLLKNSVYVSRSGKLVAQRNSTFFPAVKDALGRTNVERMKQGLAPIGKDGKAVELHHLKQKNDGIIIELTNKEHKINSKILHQYKKKSEINRNAFNSFKKDYWKKRAKEF